MRGLGVFLGLIVLAGWQPLSSQELTETERRAITEQIHERTLGWMAADERGDGEASLAYFVEDSEGDWVGEPALFMNGRILFATKASVGAWFDSFFVGGRATKWSLDREFISVLSADHAVQVFEGAYSVVSPAGEAGSETKATVTTVWVRKNGTWMILHCHQS